MGLRRGPNILRMTRHLGVGYQRHGWGERSSGVGWWFVYRREQEEAAAEEAGGDEERRGAERDEERRVENKTLTSEKSQTDRSLTT
eukprot:754700-Hanusia_phi.AAC.5